MKRVAIILFAALLFTAHLGWGARADIDTISRDPYLSALVLDADTGEVLFEENSTAIAYPASVLKLMVLYVVLDRIEQGMLRLEDMVQVTGEAARMGGSQVYLDPKEQFSVEDLLYALIVQSANDAATALAIHVAGSKDAFVKMMNDTAAGLGMNNTTFYSVHGLPPSQGQQVDRTTARDLGILARELAKNPEVFKYTGTRERGFRNGEFIMRNHNKLLDSVDGCDGFKTGYFKAAGFSIIATAKRGGVRIIAVVLGSADRLVRDAKASELMAVGFTKVPPREEAAPAIQQPAAAPTAEANSGQPEAEPAAAAEADRDAPGRTWGRDLLMLGVGFAAGIAFSLGFAMFTSASRSNRKRRLM
ncbi:MAG: D-alanyl-D-alanine carboxypeptidase [Desulfofustis sp.]|jgi:D-alanyl-D-alanine carboxypeptidase (penicillin-binding protein 5/6)|nr:D-alanyl-D-alanine carboxypeptidase [Desulfofustis sp.]